jgi:hypothetical protein
LVVVVVKIKWLVSYFNMLRRVVLSVPKHIRDEHYDESEVETLRDWIIKQGVVKTAELAKLRTRATDGSSK